MAGGAALNIPQLILCRRQLHVWICDGIHRPWPAAQILGLRCQQDGEGAPASDTRHAGAKFPSRRCPRCLDGSSQPRTSDCLTCLSVHPPNHAAWRPHIVMHECAVCLSLWCNRRGRSDSVPESCRRVLTALSPSTTPKGKANISLGVKRCVSSPPQVLNVR